MEAAPAHAPAGAIMLRDVIEADLPIFFEQQLDPEAARMAAFPSREREPFMAHWAKIMSDPSVVTQAILYDGQVAGNIVSWVQSGEREVGYWLGHQYWSRGIATAALALFLRRILDRPLRAYVAKRNLASRRVLEKCGFAVYGEDEQGFLLALD
jgi:RimJ/RimL family protein N-acetyltransferase